MQPIVSKLIFRPEIAGQPSSSQIGWQKFIHDRSSRSRILKR
jgi:hypothetical protein